jgi:hypothetical protein
MEDDEEADEQARRDYLRRRKSEIFWEIEDLWQGYLKELDYPKVKFSDYVALKSDPL